MNVDTATGSVDARTQEIVVRFYWVTLFKLLKT